MSSRRLDLHAPSASTSLSFLALRSRWPYILGAIAGPMFGLSMLLLLAAPHIPGQSGETAGLFAIRGGALAGVLLGIAWFGVLRGGQGGAGPIAGSFAFPLVVAYQYFDGDSYELHTTAALVAGAFAAFGWGHVAAPCTAALRGLAAVGAALWSLLFVAIARRWAMPDALVALAFVALSLTGICLAFSLPQLRYAAPRHAP